MCAHNTVCPRGWSGILRASKSKITSPFHFTWYMTDFRYVNSGDTSRSFLDDSAIARCVRRNCEAELTDAGNFVSWCEQNHQHLMWLKHKKDEDTCETHLHPLSQCKHYGELQVLGVNTDKRRRKSTRLTLRPSINKAKAVSIFCQTFLRMLYEPVVVSAVQYVIV